MQSGSVRSKRHCIVMQAPSGKQVTFDDESRFALRRGIDAVAKAVKITLGPKGRNVVLGNGFGVPRIVNDGVTIAKEVQLEDPRENAGVRLIQEVASKTNDVAGDGTTTATVLAQEIVNEGLKNVAAGANPISLKRGIEKAVKMCVDEIKRVAIPVDEEGYEKVATISSGDPEIGKMIGDAMRRVGRDGVISVESSKSMDTVIEIEEGMELDRGYVSSQFVTNQARLLCEYENVRVLITDKKISAVAELLPTLEKVTQASSPLLIIADDVTGEALSTLVLNKNAGIINVVAIRAPSFGARRLGVLEDIAVLTGGFAFLEEKGAELDKLKIEDLGFVRKVTVGANKTTMIAGEDRSDLIQERVKSIKRELAAAELDYDKEKLLERINKLAGGLAVIKVGAPTETEMESNKLRVEDAVNATKAAVEEGIVPGGGVCLLKLIPKVREFKATLTDPDEITGADIIARSLESPLRQIADNAGEEGAVIVEKVRDLPFNEGYDAATGKFVDMIKEGIIDPAKVTRSALENASSIASMVLTTNVLVSDEPVDEKDENARQEEMMDDYGMGDLAI